MSSVGLAFGLTVAAGLSTAVGSSLVCCSRLNDTRVLAAALALAAGVMLYVSFAEILPKAADSFQGDKASVLAATFFFVGIVLSAAIDFVVDKLSTGTAEDGKTPAHHKPSADPDNVERSMSAGPQNPKLLHELVKVSHLEGDFQFVHDIPDANLEVGQEEITHIDRKKLLKTSALAAVCIALHNFPEGLVTFMATIADPSIGIGIAIAVALHNIPEGITVAFPILYATGNRRKAFLWSLLSGIAEPVGALVGYLAISGDPDPFVFGVLFALVAGMMVFISIRELIPSAHKHDPEDNYSTKFLFLGMFIMALSLEIPKL